MIIRMENWFPVMHLSKKFDLILDIILEKIFVGLKLLTLKNNFTCNDIKLRTYCFIKEAKKRGINFQIFQGPFGYTDKFIAKYKNKKIRFEVLPVADFVNKHNHLCIDDKEFIKNKLKRKGFPVSEGKSFWFWQRKKAEKIGINVIKYPLVIKPRCGSGSKYVTTNIDNRNKFINAIKEIKKYSPNFMVEKYIPDAFVHRITIVDFDFIACVKQIPANVIGDGVMTINELIDKKNSDYRRGKIDQKEILLKKIIINNTTKKLLNKKGYNFDSIPKKDEIIYLQKDPFLNLGGDVIELTSKIHPDNIRLFHRVAMLFDIRLVGMDFICKDISRSWKKQNCAILELNSLPCIEMHHYPTSGIPQDVAKAVVDLFFKYYINK